MVDVLETVEPDEDVVVCVVDVLETVELDDTVLEAFEELAEDDVLVLPAPDDVSLLSGASLLPEQAVRLRASAEQIIAATILFFINCLPFEFVAGILPNKTIIYIYIYCQGFWGKFVKNDEKIPPFRAGDRIIIKSYYPSVTSTLCSPPSKAGITFLETSFPSTVIDFTPALTWFGFLTVML